MTIVDVDTKVELPTADKTGDYLNEQTGHRAQFIKGDPVPPGYKVATDDGPQVGGGRNPEATEPVAPRGRRSGAQSKDA